MEILSLEQRVKNLVTKYKVELNNDNWYRLTFDLFNRVSANKRPQRRLERELEKLKSNLEYLKLPYLKGINYCEKTSYTPSNVNDAEEYHKKRADIELEISNTIIDLQIVKHEFKGEFDTLKELIDTVIKNPLINDVMICVFVDGLSVEESAAECWCTTKTVEEYKYKGIRKVGEYLKINLEI